MEHDLDTILKDCKEMGGGPYLASNGLGVYKEGEAMAQLAALVVYLHKRIKKLETES